MTDTTIETNFAQSLIGCNCFTIDSTGVTTHIAVETANGNPAIFTGQREPYGGYERFIRLSSAAPPAYNAWVLTHADLGKAQDNDRVKILLKSDPNVSPPFAIVKIVTGRSDVKRVKVDHGFKARRRKTAIVAESGTVKSRTGDIVSHEAIVALRDGGTVGVLFWDGSAAVLHRSGDVLRIRRFNSTSVRLFHERNLTRANESASIPAQDWAWRERIKYASTKGELEAIGRELLDAASRGELRKGVVRGFHLRCEERRQLGLSLWFGEELGKVPRRAHGDGFDTNRVENCSGDGMYKGATGEIMYAHPRNPNAGKRKRTCKGKLSRHMTPTEIAARRAAKKAAKKANAKKGKQKQPATA